MKLSTKQSQQIRMFYNRTQQANKKILARLKICQKTLCRCFLLSKGLVIGFILGSLATFLLMTSLLSLFGLSPAANKIIDEVVHLTHPVATETNSLVKVSFPSLTRKIQSLDRILCWVITSPKTHSRAQLIKQTWGRRCDKLLFMSSIQGNSSFLLTLLLLDFSIFSLMNWKTTPYRKPFRFV
jgi:hypothetical protein